MAYMIPKQRQLPPANESMLMDGVTDNCSDASTLPDHNLPDHLQGIFSIKNDGFLSNKHHSHILEPWLRLRKHKIVGRAIGKLFNDFDGTTASGIWVAPDIFMSGVYTHVSDWADRPWSVYLAPDGTDRALFVTNEHVNPKDREKAPVAIKVKLSYYQGYMNSRIGLYKIADPECKNVNAWLPVDSIIEHKELPLLGLDMNGQKLIAFGYNPGLDEDGNEWIASQSPEYEKKWTEIMRKSTALMWVDRHGRCFRRSTSDSGYTSQTYAETYPLGKLCSVGTSFNAVANSHAPSEAWNTKFDADFPAWKWLRGGVICILSRGNSLRAVGQVYDLKRPWIVDCRGFPDDIRHKIMDLSDYSPLESD